MPKPCTPIRIWIAVAVVLGAIAISLNTSEPSYAEDCELELFEKYRYLFRTEEEQKAIEDVIPKSSINHGCCNTTKKTIKPRWAITIYNTIVAVVQGVTIGGRTFYQYFTLDNCTQLPGCHHYCTCQLDEGYFPAYVNYTVTGKPNISLIRLKACCKCVNRHP